MAQLGSSVLGPIALVSYILAQSATTMLVRFSRTADHAYAFEPTALLFASLAIRLLMAVLCAVLSVGVRDAVAQWRAILPNCLAYALPSAMYLIYDQFYFWVFRTAEPVTWMALSSSLKVALTAIFVKRVFDTRFDLRTLAPLVTMAIGAFLIEYDPQFTLQHSTSFYLVFLGGLSLNCCAAVLRERAFKMSMATSIHVQNAVVYVFMLASNLVSYAVLGAWQRDASIDAAAPLFSGMSWFVIAICGSETLVGLSMSYVSKVYSSITKVLAGCMNLALVSLAGAVLFRASLTLAHVVGIVTITASMYAYQRDATLHSDVVRSKDSSVGKV